MSFRVLYEPRFSVVRLPACCANMEDSFKVLRYVLDKLVLVLVSLVTDRAGVMLDGVNV